jgi:FtsP/CotA-like multicopper oxidase with cupredoxin domain
MPACLPACLQVLGQGNGSYTPAANAAGLNTANPPFRDTVTLPKGGWVVLRFVADNKGLWVMHCHLPW